MSRQFALQWHYTDLQAPRQWETNQLCKIRGPLEKSGAWQSRDSRTIIRTVNGNMDTWYHGRSCKNFVAKKATETWIKQVPCSCQWPLLCLAISDVLSTCYVTNPLLYIILATACDVYVVHICFQVHHLHFLTHLISNSYTSFCCMKCSEHVLKETGFV